MNNLPAGSGRAGLLYGLTAYGLWGLVPLYFKAVDHVAPVELLAHRIVWSFIMVAGLLLLCKRWGELTACLRSRSTMATLLASTLLIALNWLVFLYAVCTAQVLATSLGFFIAPLVHVLLGVVCLGERLRPGQWLALTLACLGVLNLTVAAGELPWIALTLAGSFSCYGLLRKTAAVSSLTGLTVETAYLAPLAAAVIVAGGWSGSGVMGRVDRTTDALLVLSGLITIVPLLCFVQAARLLPLSTLAFLQYLSPSVAFLLAIGVFDEPFSAVQLTSFVVIWTGLVIFTADTVRGQRRQPERPAVESPEAG